MSGFSLPDGVSVNDLPGFRDQDVKRDRAFDRADSDVRAGRFDSDDVIAALKKTMRDDWKGLLAEFSTDDATAIGTRLTIALRDVLAEQYLSDNRP